MAARDIILNYLSTFDAAGASAARKGNDDVTDSTKRGQRANQEHGKSVIELELSKRRLLTTTATLGQTFSTMAGQGLTTGSALSTLGTSVGFMAHAFGGLGTMLGPVILLTLGLTEGIIKFTEKTNDAQEKTARMASQIEAFSSATDILRDSQSRQSVEQARLLEIGRQQLEVDKQRTLLSEEAKKLNKDIAATSVSLSAAEATRLVIAKEVTANMDERIRVSPALVARVMEENEEYANQTAKVGRLRIQLDSLNGQLVALTAAHANAGSAALLQGLAEKSVDTELQIQIGFIQHEITLTETQTKLALAHAKTRVAGVVDEMKQGKDLNAFTAKMAQERGALETNQFAVRRAALQLERDTAIKFIADHVSSKSQAERAMTELERLEAAKRVKIDTDETRSKIMLATMASQQTAGVAGALANYLETTGRASFNTIKALRIGEAVVNTAAGVMNAIGGSGIPYPYNLVAAASVAALGAIQIATIQATSAGSAPSISVPSLGGSTGGTTPAPPAGPGTGLAPSGATGGSRGGMNIGSLVIDMNVQVTALDPSSVSDATVNALGRRILQALMNQIHGLGGSF